MDHPRRLPPVHAATVSRGATVITVISEPVLGVLRYGEGGYGVGDGGWTEQPDGSLVANENGAITVWAYDGESPTGEYAVPEAAADDSVVSWASSVLLYDASETAGQGKFEGPYVVLDLGSESTPAIIKRRADAATAATWNRRTSVRVVSGDLPTVYNGQWFTPGADFVIDVDDPELSPSETEPDTSGTLGAERVAGYAEAVLRGLDPRMRVVLDISIERGEQSTDHTLGPWQPEHRVSVSAYPRRQACGELCTHPSLENMTEQTLNVFVENDGMVTHAIGCEVETAAEQITIRIRDDGEAPEEESAQGITSGRIFIGATVGIKNPGMSAELAAQILGRVTLTPTKQHQIYFEDPL